MIQQHHSNFLTVLHFSRSLLYKHIVGFAIRLKYCKPPPAAKDVKIGEKKKTWSS